MWSDRHFVAVTALLSAECGRRLVKRREDWDMRDDLADRGCWRTLDRAQLEIDSEIEASLTWMTDRLHARADSLARAPESGSTVGCCCERNVLALFRNC